MPPKREQSVREHKAFLARTPGVEVLSSLDLEAIPPFDMYVNILATATGSRRRKLKELGLNRHLALDRRSKPANSSSAIPMKKVLRSKLPQPEILSRNGSYMAYRRLQQHVAAFRDFLREQGGPTAEDQELLAAKLMGRWRSGAPLVLAPDKDDPSLADDPQRNNNFNYAKMDPQGYAVPLGAHIRRMNPRDTAVNIQRRKIFVVARHMGQLCLKALPRMGSIAVLRHS